jgi:farnesyl-diphosphate farnesyltransferase
MLKSSIVLASLTRLLHVPRKFTYPCGTKNYLVLMQEYPRVTDVFLSLRPEYQTVIADITRRMGHGMAEFIEREVVTLKDWDLYCHYVAGLVGIGLSNLFGERKAGDYTRISN